MRTYQIIEYRDGQRFYHTFCVLSIAALCAMIDEYITGQIVSIQFMG